MKFSIAMICIMTITCGHTAFGAGLNFENPKKVISLLSDIYGAATGTFDTNINTTYTKLSSQLGTYKGTFGDDDEGAVVLVIARKIYEHGAQFCATQIQAGNDNGIRDIWLRYLKMEDERCHTLCEVGYSGDNCTKDGSNIVSTGATYSLSFGNMDVMDSGGKDNEITDKVDVFAYENQNGNNNHIATHVVLGATKILPHGVIAAPIEIKGERTDRAVMWISTVKSKIISAKTNNNTTILCRYGYQPNATRTDCVKQSWCNGFSDDTFNPNEHVEKTRTVGSGNCRYFVCKQDRYGFANSDTKLCTPCNTAVNPNNGVCSVNYGGNIPPTQISMSKMRECWDQIDASDFKDCVTAAN